MSAWELDPRVLRWYVLWKKLEEYVKRLTAVGSLVIITKITQTFTFRNDI